MEEYHQITLNEWQTWVEEVRQKLQEAAGNFVYIGYRLKQIRDSGMYDGKSDFFEWAQAEYGLSKSTVSRFIAINEKFADPDNRIELKKEYQSLGSSKLSEMLTLPDKECELITEQTTVKEIRELKGMDKEPVTDEGDTEYTPLQKCVIDYFRDKQDILKDISESLDDKEIAELIAPSGYASHKKGTVFLFMYDYQGGVKYKVMGKPDVLSMTWQEFINDVLDPVFFSDLTPPEKLLKELYPDSPKKEDEPENGTAEAEKSEKDSEESKDEAVPKEAEPEKAGCGGTESVAAEPEIVADQKEDGTTEPVATSQQKQWEHQVRNSLSNLNTAVENKAWCGARAYAVAVVQYLDLVIKESKKGN